MKQLDGTAKTAITLVAVAAAVAAAYYLPFIVGLPLLAAIVVATIWLWRH